MSNRMKEDKSLREQLDEFNQAIDALENLDVRLEDEDNALMLLNVLHKSLEKIKDTLLFERQTSMTF